MRADDEDYGRQQKVKLVRQKKLLRDQEGKPGGEQCHGHIIFMMRAIAMQQRIHSHAKCNSDHPPFKNTIVNDIDAE